MFVVNPYDFTGARATNKCRVRAINTGPQVWGSVVGMFLRVKLETRRVSTLLEASIATYLLILWGSKVELRICRDRYR